MYIVTLSYDCMVKNIYSFTVRGRISDAMGEAVGFYVCIYGYTCDGCDCVSVRLRKKGMLILVLYMKIDMDRYL